MKKAKITSYYIDKDKVLHTFIENVKHVTFSEVNNDEEAQMLIDEENALLEERDEYIISNEN